MNGAATQIASREFDRDFLQLPLAIQANVQRRIDAMGLRLDTYPHYRLTASDRFRLRIGDYRVIYRFDMDRGEIYLIAIGHRREIYRH
jgi:mRNA interferase RelE/StbE